MDDCLSLAIRVLQLLQRTMERERKRARRAMLLAWSLASLIGVVSLLALMAWSSGGALAEYEWEWGVHEWAAMAITAMIP